MDILIVEDQADSLDVLRRLLVHLGHRAVGASSVAEALAACRNGHFDLMICDIGLPDGSGLDLGAIARQRGIKAIVMSGFDTREFGRRVEQAGFNDHLLKPFSLDDLRHSIDRLFLSANHNLRSRPATQLN